MQKNLLLLGFSGMVLSLIRFAKNVLLKALSSKSSNFLLAYVASFKNTFCDVIRKRYNVTVYDHNNHKKMFQISIVS